MEHPISSDLRTLRAEFLKVPVLCLAVITAIHFFPKGHQNSDPFRLTLAVIYFAAWCAVLTHLLREKGRYFRQIFAWRYRDCGPALEQTWHRFLVAATRAIDPLLILLLALIVSIGFDVLQTWPLLNALDAFEPLYSPIHVLSIVGLVLYPIVGGYLVHDAWQKYRILCEECEVQDFKPRRIEDLGKEEMAGETVEALEPLRFRAGHFDWSWEDFYTNAIVFGQPGAGKTVCVLNALLDGLLASGNALSDQPSALILDPKGDFRKKIRFVAEKHERSSDLVVFAPTEPDNDFRWNPLDSDDDPLQLAGRFACVLESVGMKNEQDSFWIDSARKFIRHAIQLVRLTNSADEPPCLRDIYLLATTDSALDQRIAAVPENAPTAAITLTFFVDEWRNLASETRSSIQAHISNMIDPFLMEPYATTFSGRSSTRISDMLDQGKLLYVYMPIADREKMAKVVCTFIKLEYYREVLRRPGKTRPSFFLCDEFQTFFTTAPGNGDADFFERSRQSRHANVIATQNLPALKKVVKDEPTVQNLLGNCAVKLFLRNTDSETNKYGSDLFGERLVGMPTGSGPQGGRFFGMIGARSAGSNVQYDAKVRKEAFSELAVPDASEGVDYAESIAQVASRGHILRRRLRWRVHPLTA